MYKCKKQQQHEQKNWEKRKNNIIDKIKVGG